MINFLILNWTAGLISGLILLLGAFLISFAIDRLGGGFRTSVILVVISTFSFAILSFVMSINRLLTLSSMSSTQYIWEPYIFLFGSIFFTLGATVLHYQLKPTRDITQDRKNILGIIKDAFGKKIKF